MTIAHRRTDEKELLPSALLSNRLRRRAAWRSP
jgi:hypothetical protein